jgi:beta-glucanase (GH16 family)
MMKRSPAATLVASVAALVAAASIAVATSDRTVARPDRTLAASGSRGTGRPRASSAVPTIALPPGFAAIATYSTLVKDYEFSGSKLPADWSATRDYSFGDQATEFQPSQVRLTGTSVAFTAISRSTWPGLPYTSGAISTAGGFFLQHGLIDFRAKVPVGQGLWSGLWLDQVNDSNPSGEIDVAEMLLGDSHTVYGSLHSWAPSLWGETQQTRMAADASQGFHDYQVIWQPGMVTWAIDGAAYAQYTKAQALVAGRPWPFDDTGGYFLIADLAVAAATEWGGGPNSSTVLPATMQVQSIRIWR